MKRVYLDQNQWIGLSRARRGLESGKPYQDALLIARTGVEQGLLSFPLSHIHYIETWRCAGWEPRFAVADVMAELSKLQTIAPSWKLVPAEIDRAVIKRFGKKLQPRKPQVFGGGIKHAFADDNPIIPDFSHLLTSEQQHQFKEQLDAQWQLWTLRGPKAKLPASWLKTTSHLKVEQRYHADEAKAAQDLKSAGWGKGDKLDRVMMVKMFANLEEPLKESLIRQSVSPDAFLSLGQVGITDFFRDIPSEWVVTQMRRDLYARNQHEPNDLRDLAALGIACTYCNVVATEKQWASVLRTAGIEEMLSVKLVSKPKDLAEALI